MAHQGDTDLRLYADTRFRQGELLFSQGAYLEAGQSYQAVVDLGTAVPAYEQSLYKLGWSLFKQERYAAALPILFAFLERKISPTGTYAAQLPGLSGADREQVADSLRVISRSFAQLGGVDSVAQYFKDNGASSYEEQVYLELAQWYVEQGQVSEAAAVWLVQAQREPLAAEAPRLTGRAIKLYQQAGFSRLAVELEKQFVQTYHLGSDFWTIHSQADFPQVMQLLQSSQLALSRLAHEQALQAAGPAEHAALTERAAADALRFVAHYGDHPAAP